VRLTFLALSFLGSCLALHALSASIFVRLRLEGTQILVVERLRSSLAPLARAGVIAALLVYLTGGLWLRTNGTAFELTRFGWLLAPVFAALVLHAPTPWLRRIWRLALTTRARFAVAATVLGLTALGHALAVGNRYLSFRTTMDLAIYGNACRNALFSTIKGDVWLFADHFEPALALFVPLCRIADPAWVLLIAQVLAWLAGAIGVYFLARQARWSFPFALLAAWAYLQFDGLITIAYYDFHLLALMLGVLPWLWFALVSRRYLLLCALAVFACGLKESVPLTLIGFGALLACERPRWRGVALTLFGALVFVAIMKWVYPVFRGGQESFYFAKYYGHLGNSLGDFVHTALTRPLYFLGTLLTAKKIGYVATVLAPTLFIVLLRPSYLLPVLPALFINVASNDSNLFSLGYHYEAEIFPSLFCATLLLAKDARLRRFRLPSLRLIWLAALLIGFTDRSPTHYITKYQPSDDHHAIARLLAEKVPSDVKIAANQRIAAHLTMHPQLYMMDYWLMENDWQRADAIVVAYPERHLGWYSWEVMEREKIPHWDDKLALVYRDPFLWHFRIWYKR